MTLGEKIKEARKQCGLSQEQLAEALVVSRSAVAKWEADNGMPDIENLKAIARVLDVSIDYLLDDGDSLCVSTVREPYNLTSYGKGGKRKLKDMAIRERFPNAAIHPLIAKQKLTQKESFIDNLIGFLTDAPFGLPGVLNDFKNSDKQFYMVEDGCKQYIVNVTDEYIEIKHIATPITAEKFEIGDMKFRKCSYTVK